MSHQGQVVIKSLLLLRFFFKQFIINFVFKLFKREKITNIFKYIIVGGIAFIADFSFFYFAINFIKINYFFAGLYSFIVGVFVNYVLARKFVFYNYLNLKKSKEIFGVYLISGIRLLIHQFSIYFFVDIINSNLYMAKIITSFIVLIWNYNIRRKYLYGD